jgi:ech hydrogenase subunit A
VVIFALAQIGPLIYFDGFMHPEMAEPTLFIDQLSIILCLITSIIGSLICMYAIRYMRDHEEHLGLKITRQPQFFFWLVMFLGAMNGLVFSNDIFWMYFFWEVTTLCCYQLIRHDLTTEAKNNALRALWMCSLGGAAFAFGILRIFDKLDTLSLQAIIGTDVGEAGFMLFPLGLLCLAGFTKSAQVPFQSWLLGAMVAPTPVSALLHSSTMVNAGVYMVLRLAPAMEGTALSTAVAVFGGFVFLVTSILAISQTGAKRLLAYSTIGNLGLIFCCAGINTPLAITAALMLLIFHAISKGLMFLNVGIIESHIKSRDIEPMQGLAAKFPIITGITVAGIITMLLMPFGVLVSKWAGTEAAASMPSDWSVLIIILIALGSALTVVFWTKWAGRLLAQPPGVGRVKLESVPFFYGFPVTLLLLLAIGLSIFLAPFFEQVIEPALSQVTFATTEWNLRSTIGFFAPWPLAILAAVVVLVPMLFIRGRKEEVRPVYACGENDPEYSVSQFRTIGDDQVDLETGGFYLQNVLGEGNLNRWINPLAILILVVLFWVTIE